MKITELKIDKNGLLYTNNYKLVKKEEIFQHFRENDEFRYDQYCYYSLDDNNEYIIKFHLNPMTSRIEELTREMLIKLKEKQGNVQMTDFPVGYFRRFNHIRGLITKYYDGSISFDKLSKEKDINATSKYYSHDGDSIHNLFLGFDESLTALNEMYDNGIYYTDVNPGNFLFHDNKIKIVDFDPIYVTFDKKDEQLSKILSRYKDTTNLVLQNMGITNQYESDINNFEDAKAYTKKVENSIRRTR